MSTEKNSYDLLKIILNLLILSLLIIITYQVVEIFLFGFFWAVMVVIATWPLMLKLQHILFNRRYLSVLVMMVIFSLVFVIPFILIIASITKNGSSLIEWVRTLSQQQLPTLDWLQNLPVIGAEFHEKWQYLIQNDGKELIKEIQPYIGTMVSWILEQATNIGLFIFHCAVMIVFSVLLFFKGEEVNKYAYHFANRLSKQYGESAITLAGKSIRAVALGVVVTAVTLSLLGGLSFFVTDMPFAGLITLLLFICCVAQIGPVIVMLPCIAWQFWNNDITSAIILIIMTIILAMLDGLMRTLLIKKGVNLPILLILFGVIGGLLGFGVMGLFIGPVVLALSYNLICAWIDEQD